MANYLRTLVVNYDLTVKPSVGQGKYADIPWICLLSNNRRISPSAQKGLYIVLLFNKECDAVYLTLNQGITNFNNIFPSSQVRNAKIEKTVAYFQEELPEIFTKNFNFVKTRIHLGDYISAFGKGYIKTTIVSKRFDLNTFNETDFIESIHALCLEYEDIILHIGDKSYDDIIDLIDPRQKTSGLVNALEEIDSAIREDFIENRDIKIVPIHVQKGDLRSNKYIRLTQTKVYKKVDYIKQAKEQYLTGLKGELIALEIEKKRLEDLNLDSDLHIKWCSVESDGHGYDFESVDYFQGKLMKIFIEVKATKDIIDTEFYLSKNEIEVSRQKNEHYRVMRLFDINSIIPKYYIADGKVDDNFYLDPITFRARYKYHVR